MNKKGMNVKWKGFSLQTSTSMDADSQNRSRSPASRSARYPLQSRSSMRQIDRIRTQTPRRMSGLSHSRSPNRRNPSHPRSPSPRGPRRSFRSRPPTHENRSQSPISRSEWRSFRSHSPTRRNLPRSRSPSPRRHQRSFRPRSPTFRNRSRSTERRSGHSSFVPRTQSDEPYESTDTESITLGVRGRELENALGSGTSMPVVPMDQLPTVSMYAEDAIERTKEKKALLEAYTEAKKRGIKTGPPVAPKHTLSSRTFKHFPRPVLFELALMSESEPWKLLIDEIGRTASHPPSSPRSRTIKDWINLCMGSDQNVRRYMNPLIGHYRSSLRFRNAEDQHFTNCY